MQYPLDKLLQRNSREDFDAWVKKGFAGGHFTQKQPMVEKADQVPKEQEIENEQI